MDAKNPLTVLLRVTQRRFKRAHEIHMCLEIAFAVRQLLVKRFDHDLLLVDQLRLLFEADDRLGVDKGGTIR
jgi:hypothetical protein